MRVPWEPGRPGVRRGVRRDAPFCPATCADFGRQSTSGHPERSWLRRRLRRRGLAAFTGRDAEAAGAATSMDRTARARQGPARPTPGVLRPGSGSSSVRCRPPE